MAFPTCPGGFTAERHGRGVLYARPDLIDVLREIGLTRTRRWIELLSRATAGPGRGGTARVELPGGPRVVLKKMRRGGLTATLWSDRFPATRLIANLVLPGEALQRGIPTPPAVALLLRPAALGTFEGWLMTEELEAARDLLSVLRAGPPPRGLLTCVAQGLRSMHDRGLRHPDLNLGNLLVRSGSDGSHQTYVVDLDRARLEPGTLDYRGRLRALRRLERSYAKNFGDEGPLGADAGHVWYATYATGDPELARRLEASRRVGRLWLGLHRLGWKR